MQTAPAPFIPPPLPNGYQPLSEAEIYAIKRQYLGLLPLQQSSAWPYDIRAAIASIQAQKAEASQTLTSPEFDASAPGSLLEENPTQPQLGSSSQQSTPTLAQAGPSASAPSASQPVASQSQLPPTVPSSNYPHQPYYHPAYPHAPYYTSAHAPYGYTHLYPSYPHPPGMYPVNPAGHHPPLFTTTPLVHPPHHGSEAPPLLNSIDDLPSYEEMIVEALLDSGDPEGCAPKSLFSWMAMHYPLQTNFRPSASQALQKAYKRGRLEKGSNGKYRLNENWEGGNTSKRTTRRPQTLAQSTLPGPLPPSSSPFTHSPLVPHGVTSLPTRLPPPGQPPGYGGYSFGYPYQGTSGSTFPPSRDSSKSTSQKQGTHTVDHETGEGSDAWEAAQNILKAINFGQLFQISGEGDRAGEPSSSASSLNQQGTGGGSDDLVPASGTMVLAGSANAGRSMELDAEQRAALQAQLALLAAQLAELANVTEDELSHNLQTPQRTAATPGAYLPPVLHEGLDPGLADDGDDGDNEDMVEVPVPMAPLAF